MLQPECGLKIIPPRFQILASAGYDNSIVMYRPNIEEQSWVTFDKLLAHTSTVWCLDFNAAGDRLGKAQWQPRFLVIFIQFFAFLFHYYYYYL